MKVLLDTHALLWWLTDDSKLGAEARRRIGDEHNQAFVSAVSIAEITIKASLGKLTMPPGLVAKVDAEGFTELPLRARHAEALQQLPWIHRDPFDRMLLAQAMVEGLTFITADDRCARYDVPVVPADG